MKVKGNKMSIWKTPDQKPDIDKQIIIINDFGYVIYFGKCAVAPGNKWCYVDDLIAQADKAERLQKAVDYTIKEFTDLMNCFDITDETHIDMTVILENTKQLIKDE